MNIELQVAAFFADDRAQNAEPLIARAIDTIPKLDDYLAAKNKRLGIPYTRLIKSPASDKSLAAPEYRPSAEQIATWVMNSSGADYMTVGFWLRTTDFREVAA